MRPDSGDFGRLAENKLVLPKPDRRIGGNPPPWQAQWQLSSDLDLKQLIFCRHSFDEMFDQVVSRLLQCCRFGLICLSGEELRLSETLIMMQLPCQYKSAGILIHGAEKRWCR